MKTIAFHSNQLSIRGTEVALYDYAFHNQTLLNNKSIIISKHPSVWKWSDDLAIEKFKNQFDVIFYTDFSEVEKILDERQVDIFYASKAGRYDSVVSMNRKTVIHSVFQEYEPHGNVYAYISEWLGLKYNCPYVPYMISLPDINDDMREYLNIPKDAIVFGRHGGNTTFDLPFVKSAISRIVKERKDIYFLFLNTDKFLDHPNIIHLDMVSDLYEKVKFINTCDAMIHARHRGESFGLAIAEFCDKKKPIITWSGGTDRAHIHMLGSDGIYYSDENSLIDVLKNFQKKEIDYSLSYDLFNPINVMNKFKEVFIQ